MCTCRQFTYLIFGAVKWDSNACCKINEGIFNILFFSCISQCIFYILIQRDWRGAKKNAKQQFSQMQYQVFKNPFNIKCIIICTIPNQQLQQGVRFDPDMPQTIRLEFAKSNTKGKRTTDVEWKRKKGVSKVPADIKELFLMVMTFYRISGQQRRWREWNSYLLLQ